MKDKIFYIGQIILAVLMLTAIFWTEDVAAAFAIFCIIAFREIAHMIEVVTKKVEEIRKDQIDIKYDVKTNGFYIRQIDREKREN